MVKISDIPGAVNRFDFADPLAEETRSNDRNERNRALAAEVRRYLARELREGQWSELQRTKIQKAINDLGSIR